jgi:hypothetical protein
MSEYISIVDGNLAVDPSKKYFLDSTLEEFITNTPDNAKRWRVNVLAIPASDDIVQIWTSTDGISSTRQRINDIFESFNTRISKRSGSTSITYERPFEITMNERSKGILYINLPKDFCNTGLNIELDIYGVENNLGYNKILITGYASRINHWQDATVEVIGNMSANHVRLGKINDKLCIILGTRKYVWDMTLILIQRLVAKGIESDGWNTGYEVDVLETMSRFTHTKMLVEFKDGIEVGKDIPAENEDGGLTGKVSVHSNQHKLDGDDPLTPRMIGTLSENEINEKISDLNAELSGVIINATTAARILTLLKTVDGVESGLDADLFQGKTYAEVIAVVNGLIADASLDNTEAINTAINSLFNNELATINNELDQKVPVSRTVNSKALSANITLSASDVGAVPTARTINGKTLSSNVTLDSEDVGAVPTSRMINSKALDTNITLTASDVGAVPTTRTINNKNLSSNVTLNASDVGAFSGDNYGNIIAKTTSFTPSLLEANSTILVNDAAVITAPSNAAISFPLGTVLTIIKNTANEVSFVAGGSTVLNSKDGLLLMGAQYSVAKLTKVGTNIWILSGDLV